MKRFRNDIETEITEGKKKEKKKREREKEGKKRGQLREVIKKRCSAHRDPFKAVVSDFSIGASEASMRRLS